MSKSREQSAVDAIYEILDRLDLLDRKMEIIDANVKLLSNKISKNSRAAGSSRAAIPQSVAAAQPQSVAAVKKEPDRLVLGKIKVSGYIVNKSKMPIDDVSVNVYDDKNKLIKNTKTDNNGYWNVRLPSGKYGVEYIHKKFKPINKVIELNDNITEYEVR